MSESLSVLCWNVQSPGKFGGEADPETIAAHLQAFSSIDVFGLCEVLDEAWEAGFKAAIEESEQEEFGSFLGETGWGGDKLQVLYRKGTLELSGEPYELLELTLGGGRAPLVVPLHHRATGTRFLFMMNHLHSSSQSKRLQQAKTLNSWAKASELPIIAAGDYNFFDVRPDGPPERDEGFRLLTQDQAFAWVRPSKLVRTQFDPHIDLDWILDFVFVAGEAQNWSGEAEILLADQPRDYFLAPAMSDHRPVKAHFRLAKVGM